LNDLYNRQQFVIIKFTRKESDTVQKRERSGRFGDHETTTVLCGVGPMDVKPLPIKLGQDMYTIYGGPWDAKPKSFKGVCMAMEKQTTGNDVRVETKDFGIPEEEDVRFALKVTIAWMIRGYNVYVGCGFGRGRTGLFLACLTKVMLDQRVCDIDPVTYVRLLYNELAVETPAQRKFIQDFDTSELVDWVHEAKKILAFL
jgi:hypothetical protein